MGSFAHIHQRRLVTGTKLYRENNMVAVTLNYEANPTFTIDVDHAPRVGSEVSVEFTVRPAIAGDGAEPYNG
jgi:hypothetical protein